MSNFIEQISITNFKSIDQAELKDCRRINLLIGRPNTGKSNILEALSLFSLPFLQQNSSKKITHFIRLENDMELFNRANHEKPIIIETNNAVCKIHHEEDKPIFVNLKSSSGNSQFHMDNMLNVHSRINQGYTAFILKYTFAPHRSFMKGDSGCLIPPYGYNLWDVIAGDEILRNDVSALFKEYGLYLILDKVTQSLKIKKLSGCSISAS